MTNIEIRLTGIETGIAGVEIGIALLADEVRLHSDLRRAAGEEDDVRLRGEFVDPVVVVGADRVIDLDEPRLVSAAIGEGIDDQEPAERW